MPFLSVVIPTLNEAQGIGKTIEAVPKDRLKELGYELEILVVDGGSTDGTKGIAERAGATVITELRRGYGRAYKTGFGAANGDVLVTLDADGTYPAEAIPSLVEQLDDLDFITTNRFAKMEPGAMSLRNKLGNNVLSIVSRLFFGIPFSDSQSGMWVLRRRVWDGIKGRVKSDGMAFSQEIKIEAFRSGFRCLEAGIVYRKREGEVKLNAFRDGVGNLAHLFRKRIQK